MGLSALRGFGFDLDGCIWAGPALLPGARDLVEALRGEGRGVVFVTNSSRERAAQIAERLTRLGIPAARTTCWRPSISWARPSGDAWAGRRAPARHPGDA